LANVPYVAGGAPEQKADIYRPAGTTEPLPAILAIHGGYGDKGDMAPLARYLAARGYVVVAINYRDMPRPYPAGVSDAFCALAWMHANAADYGLDPARIVVLGHSSGGTMAATVGVVDEPDRFLEGCPHPWPSAPAVQGVVTFTGIFDYAHMPNASAGMHDYIVSYLGGELDAVPEVWAEASPITWIDGSEPPFLLIHGESDTSITPQNSVDFAAALERAGVPVQLQLVPRADHTQIISSAASFQLVVDFLAGLGKP
jgi:acetyl esterase/lipase